MTNRPIKVLLVDDHRMVLWGLAKLLESARPHIEVADLATCSAEAMAAMQKHQPHVVLLDIDLGTESGLEMVPSLARQAAVIILTGSRSAELAQAAIVAGARGILHKTEPAEVILKAITRVHAGEPWLDRGTIGKVLRALSAKRQPGTLSQSSLTSAERKVVAALVRHKSAPHKVVAGDLCISEHTLRNHLTSIYGKLGVRGRVELILHAMESRLVEAPSK